MPMTDLIKAAEECVELGKKASLPWHIVEYGDGESLVFHSDDGNRVCFMATPGGSQASWNAICANASLIEHASNHYPDIASAFLTLSAENERMRKALEERERDLCLVIASLRNLEAATNEYLTEEEGVLIGEIEDEQKLRAALSPEAKT